MKNDIISDGLNLFEINDIEIVEDKTIKREMKKMIKRKMMKVLKDIEKE